MSPSAPGTNPFDIAPPCSGYVPGWGDPNADFHLVLGKPVRGGPNTAAPDESAFDPRLRLVLHDAGLHGPSGPKNLFVSYRDPCRDAVPEGSTLAARVNAVFDAELRAVTAHVLLPVGPRAIEAVLDAYTPVDPRARAIRSRHAREIATGSWVVLPIADPETWTESDEQSVRSALEAILDRDYRREADLGRHLTGPAPYFVR